MNDEFLNVYDTIEMYHGNKPPKNPTKSNKRTDDDKIKYDIFGQNTSKFNFKDGYEIIDFKTEHLDTDRDGI
jgi:hypothetical protein